MSMTAVPISIRLVRARSRPAAGTASRAAGRSGGRGSRRRRRQAPRRRPPARSTAAAHPTPIAPPSAAIPTNARRTGIRCASRARFYRRRNRTSRTVDSARMKIAHVRERNAPAGAPWRLAAALEAGRAAALAGPGGGAPTAAVRSDPRLAHNAVLFRQPITTLDDHLARGLRVEALAEVVEGYAAAADDDEAILDAAGPGLRPADPAADQPARLLRLRAATSRRCGRGGAARCRRPGTGSRSSTSATSRRSAARASRSGRPAASQELDYELEVAALIDTPVHDLAAERGEEAIGGYMVFNDWSARDLQRDETTVRLGPAKGKDFATSIGPWLVTPDELADARQGKGYDLAITAAINGHGAQPRHTGATRSSASARWSSAPAPTSGCARRPDRLGDGRHRLPARDQGRALRALARAGRRRLADDRAAGHPDHPDRRAAGGPMTATTVVDAIARAWAAWSDGWRSTPRVRCPRA